MDLVLPYLRLHATYWRAKWLLGITMTRCGTVFGAIWTHLVGIASCVRPQKLMKRVYSSSITAHWWSAPVVNWRQKGKRPNMTEVAASHTMGIQLLSALEPWPFNLSHEVWLVLAFQACTN